MGLLNRQRGALTRTIITLVVVLAAITIGTSYLAYTSSGRALRIINTNTIIHGEPAFIGLCEAIAASCPPSEVNATLTIELISYDGIYYYVHNDTVVAGGTTAETYTNSTGGLNASGADTIFLDSDTGNSTLTYDLSFTVGHTSPFP